MLEYEEHIRQETITDMEQYYRKYQDMTARHQHWNQVEKIMDDFVAEHPESNAVSRRCRLYRAITSHCKVKLFRNYPFFFELGMRYSYNWGTPGGHQPNAYLLQHPPQFPDDYQETADKLSRYAMYNPSREYPLLWNIYNPFGFDVDHHSIGYTRMLRLGVKGIDANIAERLADPALTDSEAEELKAMRTGLAALLEIARKFADAADDRLKKTEDPSERLSLAMISAAARRIPENPPTSFYEGLASLIFYREVIATLDGCGISSLGRPDLLLIELYRSDIANGVLTEAAATQLVEQWLMLHDIKCGARERKWPETSTCITLGGCDENGTPVFNELTRIFLETHYRLNLINPKLNCRIAADSPSAYLELMADFLLKGHNQFAWINDEVMVSSLVRYGKSLKDARNYVNGGCQETICEGVEHSAGGFFYINMPECMHLWFTGTADSSALHQSEVGIKPVCNASSFAEFYQDWLDNLSRVIKSVTGWARHNGIRFREIVVAPLFSSTLAGCVENACDYTAGGARYNPTGVTMAGLANIINSLFAVRKLVFEEKFVNLATYIEAVKGNWADDFVPLREKILSLPGFGSGNQEVCELAARFSSDIAAAIRQIPNERGAFYQPGFFIYWFFKRLGDFTGATPDGRRCGTYLAQGISPSRENAPESITDVIRSLGAINFRDFPGNAVLDWQLPVGSQIPPEKVAALIRSATRLEIPTIQPNCVDVDSLRRAQLEPEKYSNVVVRISGLSALFIRLEKDVQDEIISRASYKF